jgi:peptidyl-prolyl cis-trans isomerase C
MIQHTRTLAAIAAVVAAVSAAHAQDAKGPAKGAPAAATSAPIYPASHFDVLLKERLATGQPDTPQLRDAIRDELTTRELIAREAKRKGMEKDATVKAQMELSAQNILVRSYLQDYVKNNPVSDEMLRKEYESIKGQLGDKEYKARHILVDKEEEAKEIVAALQKGEKFEKLAERSKDTGSKANGGDLGWSSPANFVKPFSDAMVGLQKGKFTPQPVRTQFGWHVIQLEDVREAKIPSFEEVKPQLAQRAQSRVVDDYVRSLRAKAGAK